MMDFTNDHLKIIYNAVRYYQMNRVALNGKDYVICDEILNNIFSDNVESKQDSVTH